MHDCFPSHTLFIIEPLGHGQPEDRSIITVQGIGKETEISVFAILKGHMIFSSVYDLVDEPGAMP